MNDQQSRTNCRWASVVADADFSHRGRGHENGPTAKKLATLLLERWRVYSWRLLTIPKAKTPLGTHPEHRTQLCSPRRWLASAEPPGDITETGCMGSRKRPPAVQELPDITSTAGGVRRTALARRPP